MQLNDPLETFHRGIISPDLPGDQSEMMQRIDLIRLASQDLPVNQFRLAQIPGSVMVQPQVERLLDGELRHAMFGNIRRREKIGNNGRNDRAGTGLLAIFIAILPI
jgi:hypothetical protein